MVQNKYVVFHECVDYIKKQDLLYTHKDVMNSVLNDKKIIKTCSFISLDFELCTKYGYTIIIDFNVDDEDRHLLYNYDQLGVMSAVKFELGSTYPGGKFDGTEDLQQMYKSGILKEYINRYEFQEYSYNKLILSFFDSMDLALYGPTYSIRSSSFFSPESISYQMKTRYIEISTIPSNQSIEGFIPYLLKWYRESSYENHKPLLEYVNEYYGKIPNFLKNELTLVSNTEKLCIKYFSYIYQLVYINQIEEQELEYTLHTEKNLR